MTHGDLPQVSFQKSAAPLSGPEARPPPALTRGRAGPGRAALRRLGGGSRRHGVRGGGAEEAAGQGAGGRREAWQGAGVAGLGRLHSPGVAAGGAGSVYRAAVRLCCRWLGCWWGWGRSVGALSGTSGRAFSVRGACLIASACHLGALQAGICFRSIPLR